MWTANKFRIKFPHLFVGDTHRRNVATGSISGMVWWHTTLTGSMWGGICFRWILPVTTHARAERASDPCQCTYVHPKAYKVRTCMLVFSGTLPSSSPPPPTAVPARPPSAVPARPLPAATGRPEPAVPARPPGLSLPRDLRRSRGLGCSSSCSSSSLAVCVSSSSSSSSSSSVKLKY